MQLKHHQWKVVVILGLLSGLLTLFAYYIGALERLEWITYDERMSYHRAEKTLHPDIAVVLIDEASLQAMNDEVGRWPWPRSVYADLLEFFAMGGAKAVAFDILFTEKQEAEGSLDDKRFAQTTADTGIAYQAMQLIKESGEELEGTDRPLPAPFIKQHAFTNTSGITDIGNNSYLLPFDALWQNAAGVGIVEMEPDSDSVYRTVRLFREYHEHIFPAMSVSPLFSKQTEVTQSAGTLQIDDIEVPLDEKGRMLFNMVGKYEPYSIGGIFDSIKRLRYGDIENVTTFPDEFEDKIVFIGASAIGLQDVKTTPLSAKHPGVYLHASITTNILEKSFLRPAPEGLTVVLVLLFALLTSASVLYLANIWLQSAIPLLLATGYAGYGLIAFGDNLVLNLTAPMVAIALSGLSGITFVAFTEGKDKRRVRAMLSQYVSPAVLEQVIDQQAGALSAEVGHRENLSILFSDVRSFTSISEDLPAERVVELLNIHFSVMTDIIFSYHGTLDKFIGDAIMAFWGAPIRIDDHADRATIAAIKMERGIQRVNAELNERDLPSIHIGIGVNTGDVILGNIGSDKKLDYTVIGDGVNLASRLEGLTKQYACPVLIAENTYHGLRSEIPCAMVDLVRVKGKHHPIRIYFPLALPDDDSETLTHAREMAELTQKAFDCYTEQQWQQALDYYQELPAIPFRDIFIERCENYIKTPPPDGWDGVYTLTTK